MKRAIIFMAALVALPASALDLEIGAGQTRWSKTPNTQYWQQEFPNSWDLLSAAYYVGVTDTSSHTPAWFNGYSNGLRFRAGWLDLGNVSNRAYATSDVNYKEGVGCINPCPILGIWDVEGRTKGVELSVAPEWQAGAVTLFVKGGVLIHRPRVDVKIYRGPADTARTHFNYPEQLNYAPTIGVGATYGKWTASLSFYKIDATTDTQEEDKRIPPNWGSGLFDTAVFMLMRRF